MTHPLPSLARVQEVQNRARAQLRAFWFDSAAVLLATARLIRVTETRAEVC